MYPDFLEIAKYKTEHETKRKKVMYDIIKFARASITTGIGRKTPNFDLNSTLACALLCRLAPDGYVEFLGKNI